LASLLHRRRSTEVNQTLHDVWPSLGLVHTYAFLGALALSRNSARGAKFALRPNFALYIDSVIAPHLSSGRQPNFAAFSRGRHLYSAGRPSCWASAHILVILNINLHYFYRPCNYKKINVCGDDYVVKCIKGTDRIFLT